MRGPIRVLALAILLLVGSTGCQFSKLVVNERVRELDPARIEVGKSTLYDVIRLLGAPPPATTQEIGTYKLADNYTKFSVREQRCFLVGVEYYIILPFTWCYADEVYEVAFEYDENLVVSAMYTVERDMIWRPFQSESDLGPVRIRDLTKASQR